MLSFICDYMEGAHPAILKRLTETNMDQTPGYGLDKYSESARDKIRAACNAPDADIHFLVGGTQTNATVIDAMLLPYQGVVAASSGHVSVHEAGAIELTGHKVLALPHVNGKLEASAIGKCIDSFWEDENHDHMVMPGLVYISQPTEYGTLYSLEELREISRVCHSKDVKLYLDGARLAYALACPSNDVQLPDIAELCDAFYIGGTKCGALFGEAVVFPKHDEVPHFFSIVKQHGALLAKGRIAGIQFDTLFDNGLYMQIGEVAIKAADRIREALVKNGYELFIDAPTNQIFIFFSDEQKEKLSEVVNMECFEITSDGRTVMRIVTSWATQQEDVDQLIGYLEQFA